MKKFLLYFLVGLLIFGLLIAFLRHQNSDLFDAVLVEMSQENNPEEVLPPNPNLDKCVSTNPLEVLSKDIVTRNEAGYYIKKDIIIVSNEDVSAAFEVNRNEAIKYTIGQKIEGTIYYRKPFNTAQMWMITSDEQEIIFTHWRTHNYKDTIASNAKIVQEFSEINPLKIEIMSSMLHDDFVIEISNANWNILLDADVAYYAKHSVGDIISGTLYRVDKDYYFDAGDGYIIKVIDFVDLQNSSD